MREEKLFGAVWVGCCLTDGILAEQIQFRRRWDSWPLPRASEPKSDEDQRSAADRARRPAQADDRIVRVNGHVWPIRPEELAFAQSGCRLGWQPSRQKADFVAT